MSGRRALIGVLFALTAGCAARTKPVIDAPKPLPLEIRALPRFGFSGDAMRLTWRIPYDPINAVWCVAIGDWRSSCETMDGVNTRQVWQQIYEPMPAGKFTIALAVERRDGTIVHTTTEVCFSGMEMSCGEEDH